VDARHYVLPNACTNPELAQKFEYHIGIKAFKPAFVINDNILSTFSALSSHPCCATIFGKYLSKSRQALLIEW
uniref:Uncharacterized protein n=1 Tax=Romanomermis culicivorax TaxID=13658 RepID=A0A915JPX1_ROMCU